jgi:hypothetical protein
VKSQPSDIPAGGHAADLLCDYLEGRLSPDSTARVHAHLDTCPTCRDLFDQGRRWRDDVLAQGARHLPPERLVALADAGKTALTAAEQAHLDSCRMCREQLTWLEALPAPEGLAATAPELEALAAASWRTRLRRSAVDSLARIPRWGWGAAALVTAACVAMILLAQPPHVGPDVTGLARLEPLVVLSVRGPAGTVEFASAFHSGLEHYARGNYAQAATAFERAAQLTPSHESVFLYLGSARLLAGDPGAAIRPLERGPANTGDPELIAEYQWQLANACLAAGRLGLAWDCLNRLAAGGGSHAQEARVLRDRIARLRGR